jgi:hypothetical protein
MSDVTQVLSAIEAGAPHAEAAVNRQVRALTRHKDVSQGMPGGIEVVWR